MTSDKSSFLIDDFSSNVLLSNEYYPTPLDNSPLDLFFWGGAGDFFKLSFESFLIPP